MNGTLRGKIPGYLDEFNWQKCFSSHHRVLSFKLSLLSLTRLLTTILQEPAPFEATKSKINEVFNGLVVYVT